MQSLFFHSFLHLKEPTACVEGLDWDVGISFIKIILRVTSQLLLIFSNLGPQPFLSRFSAEG